MRGREEGCGEQALFDEALRDEDDHAQVRALTPVPWSHWRCPPPPGSDVVSTSSSVSATLPVACRASHVGRRLLSDGEQTTRRACMASWALHWVMAIGEREVRGTGHDASQVLTVTDRSQTPTHPRTDMRGGDPQIWQTPRSKLEGSRSRSWFTRRSPQYPYCVSSRQGECCLMISDWVGELERGGPGAANGTGTGSARPAAYAYTY